MTDRPSSAAEADQAMPQELKRTLTNRHIQLISIGGAIGTGLFMGSGKTIFLAGPSILLVYAIIGTILFFVMRALGELLLSNLEYNSFSDFAADLLGPWAGFFTGWTYWFCWVVTGMADVVAITNYIHFWFPAVHSIVPVLGSIGLLLGLNIIAVKMFGELEFWFALIKIIAIVALVIVGIGMLGFGFTAADGTPAAVSYLWERGIFPKGVNGFLAGFQIAVFAFVGIELVGTAAAEAKDPETVLPKAINAIPIRIIMFYVCSLAIIMSITPWWKIQPEISPFVNLFSMLGLPAAASVINFVVLTSAASSANGGIFSTSRMLYGLADKGHAPRAFGRLSRVAIPANGLIFSCACLLLGSVACLYSSSALKAFTLATTISSLLFIFIWSIILCSYLAYRYKHPERHAHSIYRMPMGVVMSVVCLLGFAAIICMLWLQPDTQLALLITPGWFVLLGIGYWIIQWRHRAIV